MRLDIALNVLKVCFFFFFFFSLSRTSYKDMRASEENAVRRNALTRGGVIAIHYFLFLLTVTKRKGLNHMVQRANDLNYPPSKRRRRRRASRCQKLILTPCLCGEAKFQSNPKERKKKNHNKRFPTNVMS